MAAVELTRLPDWKPRLARLVNDWRGLPYRYGETDCGCFMLAAVEAVTGVDLLPGVERPRHWIAAAKFFIARGWDDGVEDMMAALVGAGSEEVYGLLSGDVVSYEEGGDLHLAVRVGDTALTPSIVGLRSVPSERWRKAWRIGHSEPPPRAREGGPRLVPEG